MLEKDWKSFYKECVKRDVYNFKRFGFNAFDYVLDIGANVGTFSTLAAITNPYAKVIALEPCKTTYEVLKNNVSRFEVTLDNNALGDGSVLYFSDQEYSGANIFSKEVLNSYSVNSLTLLNIFEKYNIKGNYFVKIDCEGGEQFILNDESKQLLLNAKGLGIEIHFSHPSCTLEKFKNFPTWETYNNYFNSFNDTHIVNYGNSNRKYGVGIYTLIKK